MKGGGGSFVIGGLLLAVAGWSGCATTKPVDYTPTQARLFLESGDASSPTVTLPRSGAVISVNSKAVIAVGGAGPLPADGLQPRSPLGAHAERCGAGRAAD